MDKQELKHWLAWNKVKEIGPIRFSYLAKSFSSLEKAWYASSKEIKESLHISENTWQKIRQEKQRIDPDCELALLDSIRVKVITFAEEGYPTILKNIYNPPPVIYYQGDFIEIMKKKKGIAIVGSRKATYYGRKVAREIAGELSSSGYVVISGLARGIDTHAHMGSLEAGGPTIAVLGCGVDRVYPAENSFLTHRIIEKGAIISEFPMNTKPDKSNFPRRNRIISGLTLGTLVVEAAEKSGALITVDFALDQGKEVFAIPGNIHSFLSTGCHNLIKQGAKLVNNYQDILDELGEKSGCSKDESRCKKQIQDKGNKENLTDDERRILKYISIEPLHIDEIVNLVELAFAQASEALLSLELKNYIKEIEGKRYIRI